MLISKRGVKRYVVKQEGATQKCQFWGGKFGGKIEPGGMIWGVKMTYIVR